MFWKIIKFILVFTSLSCNYIFILYLHLCLVFTSFYLSWSLLYLLYIYMSYSNLLTPLRLYLCVVRLIVIKEIFSLSFLKLRSDKEIDFVDNWHFQPGYFSTPPTFSIQSSYMPVNADQSLHWWRRVLKQQTFGSTQWCWQ